MKKNNVGFSLLWVLLFVLLLLLIVIIFFMTKTTKNTTNLSLGNPQYLVSVEPKNQPIQHEFSENSEGVALIENDSLKLTDIKTDESKIFDLFDLLSENDQNYYSQIPYEVQYTLHVTPLVWHQDNTTYTGAIRVISGADPPLNDSISIFEIDTNTWKVSRYPMLSHRFMKEFTKDSINTDIGCVLIEEASPQNSLSLYAYSYYTGAERLIINYEKADFAKYFPGEYGYISYFYSGFGEVEVRGLEAKWLDNSTVSYIDLINRKPVIYDLTLFNIF